MSFAPIVMFVYNRADHFEKTVTALSKCAEAVQSDLCIFSDAAKSEKDAEQVEAVRRLAHRVKQSGDFKSVRITESKENKGLANSVISGVTQVMEQYGRVIVLEDDCVPSPFFLRYMNTCLDFYDQDHTIGSVAGYAPPIVFPDDYEKDVFAAYRSCSWGWATWKDRWENVDWRLDSIQELYHNPDLIKKLNSCGTDRFVRLYRQTKSNKNSWSVKFGYHLVRNDRLTVYPRFSYIDNIGCDSTGVHSKAGDEKKTKADLYKAIPDPRIEAVELDERIQKQMKKFYSDGFISDIKRAVATKAIILKERRKKS